MNDDFDEDGWFWPSETGPNDAKKERIRRVNDHMKNAKPWRSIYVIGSMRNPRIPEVAAALRNIGWDAFDDWYSPGPETDDRWQAYEKARGRTFREALAGHHAKHAFELDARHIERCGAGLLVLPAGKSAHIEFGVFRGAGKPRYILMDGEPERFDLMYQYATEIFMSVEEMLEALR